MSPRAPLLYRLLLLLLPPRFRRDFGADLEAVLVERLHEAPGAAARAWIWLIAVVDVFTSAPVEWARTFRHQRTDNARRSSGMDQLKLDLRFALRSLARRPGFAAVAVITLALGIGANTAIFSVVDGVLLRPTPFQEADRLMVIWETDQNTETIREPASVPDYLDIRERSTRFEELAAFGGVELNLTPDEDDPTRLAALAVSHEFLPMVRINPLVGRNFTAEEDRPGGPRVALIGEMLWERFFDRDPGVIGQTLRLDDDDYTIIGVLPSVADFGMLQVLGAAAYGGAFAHRGRRTAVDVWLPLQPDPVAAPREAHSIFMLGRLAAGVSSATVQQELAGIAAELERTYPVNAGRGVFVEALPDVVFGRARPALLLLLAAVGLVLLVACVNVANLVVARGITRAPEVAVRTALGAGARRLARQYLAEGVVLTLVATVFGVAFAFAGLELLLALAPADIPRLGAVGIDGRVLAATLALAVLAGLFFGLLPVLGAAKVNVQSSLKGEPGRTISGGGSTTAASAPPWSSPNWRSRWCWSAGRDSSSRASGDSSRWIRDSAPRVCSRPSTSYPRAATLAILPTGRTGRRSSDSTPSYWPARRRYRGSRPRRSPATTRWTRASPIPSSWWVERRRQRTGRRSPFAA